MHLCAKYSHRSTKLNLQHYCWKIKQAAVQLPLDHTFASESRTHLVMCVIFVYM